MRFKSPEPLQVANFNPPEIIVPIYMDKIFIYNM